MCEIWEEMRRDGILEGETRGRQQGLIEGLLEVETRGEVKGIMKSIQKLMSKNGYTLEEAFDFFDIPAEEQAVYRQRITS